MVYGHSKAKAKEKLDIQHHFQWNYRNVALNFLVLLDMEGIYASAGSACSGGGQEISHVLSAINLDKEYAIGTIRVTIDETLSMNRAERVVQVIAKTIKKMKN